MPERDRGTGFKVVTGAFVIAVMTLLVASIFSSGTKYGEAIAYREAGTRHDSERAEYEIEERCLSGLVSSRAECVRNIIETTDEHYRAHQDLVAQTEMALWAFWMMIVSVGMALITLIGVYYVWMTLLATQGIAVDTRRIGEAQVRAYLSTKEVFFEITSLLPAPVGEFLVSISNSGQSPALNVTIKFKLFSGSQVIEDSELRIGDLPAGETRTEPHVVGFAAEKVAFRQEGGSKEMRVTAIITITAKDVFGDSIGIGVDERFSGYLPYANQSKIKLWRSRKKVVYVPAVWRD